MISFVARFFERFDDTLNPILVKELRQSVKNRVVIGILSFFLLFQLLMLILGITSGSSDQQMWSGGGRVFMTQQMILQFTILTALPIYAGARMLGERTDPGSDLMFLTSLSPSSIIWGKLLGCLTLGLLVFSVSAPFMTLAYLLRGIDLLTIFLVLGLDLLLMLLAMQFSLFAALLPGGLVIKRLAAGFGFLALFLFSYSLMAVYAFNSAFDNWLEFLPALIPIFGFFGYFLVYSIALISPPSSNAMLPVRLFLTFAVILVGLILMGLQWGATGLLLGIPGEDLPNIYAYCLAPFLCLQILVSSCERDHWGPRITRTIPKFGPLRILAFLFYSGSAGGIIHSVLMIALTLGIAGYMVFLSPSTLRFDPGSFVPLVILTLYTYCYSLLGLLFRTLLPRDQVKPENTWILTAILVGVMSTLPNVIAYVVKGDRMDNDSFAWWNLTNPFYYFFNRSWTTGHQSSHEETLLVFLGIWAVAVTLLTLPYFFRQIQRFRPTETVVEYPRAQIINELPD